MPPLLIGIDSGTTNTKAILFDLDGNVLDTFSEGYEFADAEPGHIEQRPDDWWRAAANGIRQLAATARGHGEIKALAFSTQGGTVLPVDAKYEPLANAITWLDKRGARQYERICRRAPSEFFAERAGVNLGAGGVLAKIAWWRDERPDVYEAAAAFAQVNDYLVHKLVGRAVSDPSNVVIAGLYNLREDDWDEEILALAGLSSDRVAPIVHSGAALGEMLPDRARELGLSPGVVVASGGHDQYCGALGCGVVEPGLCSVTVGTSGVVFAQTDRHVRHPDGTLHAFCHSLPRQWYVMGVMLSAGGSFEWLKGTLRAHKEVSFDELTELAEGAAPGSDGLIFLPYLSGERMPHNDPLARGGWIGLTRRHGLASMVRSVMEGITFGLYDLLSIIRRLGAPVDRIVASGGATESSLWLQMLADVLDAEIVTTTVTQGAAFGAAMLAGIGAGVFGSGRQAAEALIQVTGGCSPNREAQKEYQEAHAIYGDLYPRLRDSFRAMNDFSQRSAPEPSA